MKLGPKAMELLQQEVPGRLFAGEEILVAGPIGMEGTRLLVEQEEAALRTRFSGRFLRDAKSLSEVHGIPQEMLALAWESGADFVWEIGEGGFLSTLWKAAEVSEVGLDVDLRKIPIRQETIEVCEPFSVDPYRLLSGHSYLIGIAGGDLLAQKLQREGYMASVIGQTTDGNDRLLYSGANARYLDRPTQDEIKKVVTTWQE